MLELCIALLIITTWSFVVTPVQVSVVNTTCVYLYYVCIALLITMWSFIVVTCITPVLVTVSEVSTAWE